MAYNFRTTVVDFLKSNQGEKFTAMAIAEWVFENFREECDNKRERSTAKVTPIDSDSALIKQLVSEITAIRPIFENKFSIKTTEDKPRLYYYSEKSDVEELDLGEDGSASVETSQDISENDLYRILSKFLQSELGIYNKRIDEKRSKNSRGSRGNHWLHPDMVGLENLSSEWQKETDACVREYSDKRAKLWSFEVKKIINNSNVREAFFQAVSNSSWANFGYLVAAQINSGEPMKELRMLSALHGIGCIRLDKDNPEESQIIIPARERVDIDWTSVNRIVQENEDFKEYIELVNEFHRNNKVKEKEWGVSG